jgi:CubicO group peptidase (beta-lactamase class C family)
MNTNPITEITLGPPVLADQLENMRQRLKDCITQQTFPGCAVGVYYGGQEAYLCEGNYEYAGSREVSLDSLYDIASITKAICPSTIILMLVDQRVISLNDRVSKYLPEYKGKFKEDVTIYDLMTCAVRPVTTHYNEVKKFKIKGSEILKSMMEGDLECAPGTKYDYNNWSAILLGFIIERVKEMPLELAFELMVADPLGLKSTSFKPRPKHLIVPTEKSERPGSSPFVHGEPHDETTWIFKNEMKRFVGAAGIFSTVSDLVTFGKALLQPGLLSEKMLERLFPHRRDLPQGHKGSFYGLGWDKLPVTYRCPCFAENTIFMNGYQSCILMVNSQKKFVYVQVSNALHGERQLDNNSIRYLRRSMVKELVTCKHCDS